MSTYRTFEAVAHDLLKEIATDLNAIKNELKNLKEEKKVEVDTDKIEACLIYFPRAQYMLSLQNEDKELVEKIIDLVQNHPKLKDLNGRRK